MHSWRVLILPWLDGKGLYESYNFDEPWNSNANLSVAQRVPAAFACPSTHRHNGLSDTSYMAVVGEQTVWPGVSTKSIADVSDGTDQTLAVIEVPERDVFWTEPRDIAIDDAVDLLAGFPARRDDGAYRNYNVLLIDGSVGTNWAQQPKETWQAWFTIAGNDDALDMKSQPHPSERDVRTSIRNSAYWVFVALMVVPLPIVFRRPSYA